VLNTSHQWIWIRRHFVSTSTCHTTRRQSKSVQSAKYEFSTLKTCSITPIVAMDILWKKAVRLLAALVSIQNTRQTQTSFEYYSMQTHTWHSERRARVCYVKYVFDRVIRRDGYSMKKASSARGASFYTKHASNANVVRLLLDANSYLALSR
jgi:hypothetical protein